MSTTKITHAALPQPEMSRRRKTSIRTVIAIQMKITQAKKMSVVQRMFRKGYDVAVMINVIVSGSVIRWQNSFAVLGPDSFSALVRGAAQTAKRKRSAAPLSMKRGRRPHRRGLVSRV